MRSVAKRATSGGIWGVVFILLAVPFLWTATGDVAEAAPPGITLNAPGDGAQFSEGVAVDLDATVTDPEAGVLDVSIYGDTSATPTTLLYSRTGLASPADADFRWGGGGAASEFQLTANTVGLWHLNDGTGSTAGDETGNHDATITGATWTTGQFDSALSFSNGSNTRVQMPDSAAFDTPNLTIQMWLKPTSFQTGWNALLTKGTLPDGFVPIDLGYALLANASGQVAFALGQSPGNAWAFIGDALGATGLGTGSWRHVAVTYDGSYVRIYIDGDLDSNGTANPYAFSGGIYHAGGPIDVASSFQRAQDDSYNGLIDEIRISDVALTDAEIRSIYELEVGKYYWYVTATDVAAESTTSSTRSFDVVALPGVPTLIDPLNTAVIGNDMPTFTWSSSSGAGGTYTLQYTTDVTFTTGVQSVTGNTDTTHTLASGISDDTYYWRVQAFNSAGDSSGYQTAFSFTLDTQAPSVTLNAPGDGTQLTELTPVELNTSVSDPEGGAVDVSIYGDTNSSPTTLIYSASGLASPADVLFTWPGTEPIEFDVEASTVGLWHLNEGTDTTAADETGNHEGSISTATTWTTGRFGSALSFDNTLDTRVQLPDVSAFDTPDLTIQMWVNASSYPVSWNALATKGTLPGSTDLGYALLANASGQITLAIGNSSGLGWATIGDALSATSLGTGTWHHVAVTYDGNDIRIYINGDLDSNGTANPYAFSGGMHQAVGPIDIGASFQRASTDSWNGLIDEVMISDVALSDAEIKSIYTLQAGTYYWYVEGADSLGNTNTSAARSFEIFPEPNQPTLIAPLDAAVIGDDTPTFEWTSSTDAGGSYTLQYSTDASFVAAVTEVTGLADTTYTLPSALTDNTYYWRVQAFNTPGDSSGYQTAFSFTLDTQGPSVTLNAPADAVSITAGDSITLDVTASDPEGGDVDVRILGDTSPTPTTLLYSRSGLPSPSDALYTWGAVNEFATTAATVGHWHFNENTGTTAADETGSHDGTVTGATWAAGRFGSALSFDNTLDTRVQIPDSDDWDTPGMTFQAWVNPATLPAAYNCIATKGTLPGATDLGYAVLVTSSGIVDFAIGSSDGLGWAVIGNALSSSAVPASAWTHVAVTYDGSNVRIYLNGDLDSNGTANPYAYTGGLRYSTGPIDIASSFQRASTDSWNGLIDEVRILGTALSDAEIKASYELTAGTYYWYAEANDSLGNATTSATRSIDVVAAPTVPTLLLPLDAALLSTGTPALEWSTSTGVGGTYTLQYTTDAGFATGITSVADIAETTYTFSPALTDDTYYWRVQAFNSVGDSSGYQTPFSFTTDTTPPAEPVQINPLDLSVGNNATPKFDWSPTAGVNGTYTLQYASSSDFSTGLVTEGGLTDTTFTVDVGDALTDAVWYWRVEATDEAGNGSGYQDPTFSFTVDTQPPVEPVQINPPDASFTNNTTPKFDWSPTAGVNGIYTLQYASSSDFSTGLVTEGGLTDTTFTVDVGDALTDGVWYWRVEATDEAGNSSGYQDPTFSFTVDTQPPVEPVQINPPDVSISNNATPTFDWSPTAGTNGSYTLQYASSSDFSTGLVTEGGLTDTTFTVDVGDALTDGVWYWRVEAMDAAGNGSGYQDPTFSFTLDTDPPVVPALINPTDQLVTSNDMPSFDWSGTAGAGGTYTLQYALDAGFATGLVEAADLTDTSYAVAGPLSADTYYWHVKAKDAAGNESSYQVTPYSFTVDTRAPDITLNAPADGARFPFGDPVVLDADVSDPEGSSLEVSFIGDQNPTPTTLLQLQSGLASPANVLYDWGGTGEPMEFGVSGSTVGLWHFNEGMGIVASDATGNHPGDVLNATWTTGKFGSALSFGGDDRVEITDDPAFDSPQVTVEAWVNADAFSSTYNIVVSKGTFPTPVDLGYAFGVYNRHLVFLIGTATGSTWAVNLDAMGGTTLNTGTWYHVAATYDGVDVRLYVDGVLDSNGTANPYAYAGGMNSAVGPIDFGSSFQQPTADTWSGTIDEVRISNVALSESELKAIYTLAAGRYYWQVTASDTLGNSSTSPIRFFDVEDVPGIPVLLDPPDLAFLTDDRPTLVWTATVDLLGTYVLEYALDTGFTLGLQTITDLADTTYKIPILFPGGEGLEDNTYYWHVQSVDDLGTPSGYQARPFSFTVDTEAPDVPALIDPADSSIIGDNTPTLVWSSTAGPGGAYVVQYATDSVFTFAVTDTVLDTAFTVPMTLSDRDYYWHVKAEDAAGNESSYQSHPFMFTIDAGTLAIPNLLLPPDSSFTSDTTPTFHWSNTAAATYTLQYSVDSAFTGASTVEGIADTMYTLPDTMDLNQMTTYFWRVEAVNLAGNGSGYQAHAFELGIFITGDVNRDTVLNAADLISLVNYAFKSGPDPEPCPAAGDVNCTGAVDAADVIYLVNTIFKGGELPCNVGDLSVNGTFSCP